MICQVNRNDIDEVQLWLLVQVDTVEGKSSFK
jgi:hypothetical protein